MAVCQHTTLTRLVEEGLQLRLRKQQLSARPVRLPVYHGQGGFISGLDGLSNKALLEQAIANARQRAFISLQPMVIANFLRPVTHPKIFAQPTPMIEAVRFIDALLAASGVEPAILGGEWPDLRQPCVNKALSDNDLPDAIVLTGKGGYCVSVE